MAYVFSAPDNSMVQRDTAFVPWNTVLNQPLDISGGAGVIWRQDGSPIPSPYVAPAPTVEQLREAALVADADRQVLVAAIQDATPAQIKTFITNNVTDLASARLMLIKLALLVAKVIRD